VSGGQLGQWNARWAERLTALNAGIYKLEVLVKVRNVNCLAVSEGRANVRGSKGVRVVVGAISEGGVYIASFGGTTVAYKLSLSTRIWKPVIGQMDVRDGLTAPISL